MVCGYTWGMRSICLSLGFALCLLGGELTVWAQDVAQPAQSAEISADLGSCSAEINVTGSDTKPVYGAKVTTRIYYGFMGVKKLDLEAFTGPDGKVKLGKLPKELKKPMEIRISKGPKEETVEFKPNIRCHATFDVQLVKDKPQGDDDVIR